MVEVILLRGIPLNSGVERSLEVGWKPLGVL